MLKAITWVSKFFVQSIRMLNLSLKDLKLIAKNRGIEVYKSMSKDELLSILKTPKLPSKPIKKIKLSKT